MKTVFDNHQVAHVWAQQNQSHGRSHNGNFSFDGAVLYSYSTPIANVVTDKRGNKVALITTKTYSITTSGKHMNTIGSAIGYGDNAIMDSYRVPFIGARGGQNYTDDAENYHPSNVASMVESFRGTLKTYLRARDPSSYDLERARETAKTVTEYVERFDVAFAAPDFDVEIEQAISDRVARDTRLNTPEAIAKREKDAANRIERTRKQFREIKGKFGEFWREGWQGDERFTEDDRTAHNANLLTLNADKIGAWRNGANVSVPCPYVQVEGRSHIAAMLRVNGNRIQTSQGAEFPVEHGRRAFVMLKRIRDMGRGWKSNGETIPLGHFQIDRVTPDGNVFAGCHYVEWSEIAACAIQLGLMEEELYYCKGCGREESECSASPCEAVVRGRES